MKNIEIQRGGCFCLFKKTLLTNILIRILQHKKTDVHIYTTYQ